MPVIIILTRTRARAHAPAHAHAHARSIVLETETSGLEILLIGTFELANAKILKEMLQARLLSFLRLALRILQNSKYMVERK